jgi:adenylylsulfate kinase-like enzyme
MVFKPKKKRCRGIWFYGYSGAGKTFASKFLAKIIKHKVILIDGDNVRKFISNDLGYSLYDRKIQINRVFGICKISIKSKIFPIASTVYLNNEILRKIKKENMIAVKITRSIEKIKSLRKIYKKNTNVVGKDIKLIKLKTLIVNNKGDKSFCGELSKLAKVINI